MTRRARARRVATWKIARAATERSAETNARAANLIAARYRTGRGLAKFSPRLVKRQWDSCWTHLSRGQPSANPGSRRARPAPRNVAAAGQEEMKDATGRGGLRL